MVRPGRPSGFTLLEVLVASVVSLVVLSAAVTTVLAVNRMHRRQVETGQLKRAAAMVLEQMVAELRQAGLGRPTSSRADMGGGLYPFPIRAGNSTSVRFLTDLPRPDSNFNGFSTLSDDQNLALDRVAILNEFNGNCDVYTGGSLPCTTETASLLFPPVMSTRCDSAANQITCPWALKRYRPNENVIIVNGTGSWVERQLGSTMTDNSGSRVTLKLASALPSGFLASTNGRGYITTQDEVTYQFVVNPGPPAQSIIQRRQCWGPLATPCGSPADVLGFEPLFIGNSTASTLTFDYYDVNNTALPKPLTNADLPRVKRIGITLHLERAGIPGFSGPLKHDAFVSVSLRQ